MDLDAQAPPTRTERIDAGRPERLEALVCGADVHLEALLDVGTAPNGDLLLVLPRPAALLTDLLAVPGWPVRGEVVTVLVPLCEALERLHRAGVAHCGIAAAAVVLDADGTPLFAAPVAPVLRERAGARAFGDAVADDLDRFDDLAATLLERCGAHADLPSAVDPAAHVRALFALAEPAPIRLRPAPVHRLDPIPSRLTGPRPAVDSPAVPPRARALLDSLRRVRPRVWALASGSLAVLLAAVVLLPAGTAGAAQRIEARPTRSAVTRQPAPVGRALSPSDGLRALVVARASCIARSDAACLAVLESPGSPVAKEDVAAIRAGTDAVAVDPGRLRVVGRSGATVTGEADGVLVLAIRAPDGWRLRDVVAPPPPTGDR